MKRHFILTSPVIGSMILLFLFIPFLLHAQVPVITDFSPKSGPPGTTVTIEGTSFSATAANNAVYFGAGRAEVTAASETQLIVKVPKGATYKPISVTTGGKVAYSFQAFVPTFAGGSFTYKPKVDYPVNNNPRSVDVGDFNDDGHLDLLVITVDINSISILPGNGTGELGDPQHYTIGSGTISAIADFSGNGLLDIVVCNYSASLPATSSVLLNSGSFNFVPAAEYFLSDAPVGIGSGAVYVTEHDFNLDGHLDAAFSIDNIPGTISVLTNEGSGVFAPKTEYPVTHYPYSLASGDFNKDGYPDLAVANFFTQTMSVLMNDGTGGFLPEVTYPSDNGSHDIKIADFNHDGNLDLVVVNAVSNTVNIYTNDGTGKFPTRTDYPSGTTYQPSITLSDLNSDGNVDFIIGGSGSSIYVLKSNETGGYNPPTELAAGNSPFSIAAGDFDEDGKPDLAVSNFADHSVSLFLSKTTSTEPPPVPGPEEPADIIVYNAVSPDGDGRNDIFFIENIGGEATKANTVTIYNRWGDELWHGVNYDNASVYFDGTGSGGNMLPTGTYYYKINFNEGRSKFGYLSLKR